MNGQYWADLAFAEARLHGHAGRALLHAGLHDARRNACLPNAQIPERAWSGPRNRCCATFPRRTRATTSSPPRLTTRLFATTRARSGSTQNTRWGIARGLLLLRRLLARQSLSDRRRAEPTFRASTPSRSAARSCSTLGLTSTLGPSTVNELRLSYMRDCQQRRASRGRSGPDAGFARIRDSGRETGHRTPGAANRRHRKRLVQRLHHRRGHHRRGRRPTTPISGPTTSPRRMAKHML